MRGFNRVVLLAFTLSSISGMALAAGSKAQSTQGSSGAAAGAASEKSLPSFSEADANNNTIIEAGEAAAAGVDMVSADINKDGQLDKAEWERATPSAEKDKSSPGSSDGNR